MMTKITSVIVLMMPWSLIFIGLLTWSRWLWRQSREARHALEATNLEGDAWDELFEYFQVTPEPWSSPRGQELLGRFIDAKLLWIKTHLVFSGSCFDLVEKALAKIVDPAFVDHRRKQLLVLAYQYERREGCWPITSLVSPVS